MGNAFTAVADDEEAIFYNPAGLAGIKQFSFNIVAVDADASNDMINGYPVISDALSSNSPVASLNNLIGKNYYARVEGTSTLVLPGFGIAALADEQVALSLQNTAFPQGILGVQSTYGVQAAFGTSLLRQRRKSADDLRFGMAAKYLNRAGGYRQLTLTELLTLNAKAITQNLTNFGTGYGVDLGFQYIHKFKKKFSLMSGLAMTDIGDTGFSSGADPQKSNLTFGLAGRYTSSQFVATLAYDYAHILNYADWPKKNHVGLELKFPLLSLYTGINQAFLTYGVGIDLWIFKLMYLSYAEEQATLVNQDPERRSMIHFAMKLEL